MPAAPSCLSSDAKKAACLNTWSVALLRTFTNRADLASILSEPVATSTLCVSLKSFLYSAGMSSSSIVRATRAMSLSSVMPFNIENTPLAGLLGMSAPNALAVPVRRLLKTWSDASTPSLATENPTLRAVVANWEVMYAIRAASSSCAPL